MRTRRPARTRNHKLRGLYAARMRAGLTGAELSRRSGVSKPSISRLEWGDVSASPRIIVKLARALRVEPSVLIKKPTSEKEEA